ncbi:hypothetical protein [Methylobacter sp. BlB1]|uniref:hypothetical protein n=1 Tax=Methylobacter sp. BlB1 TaxID=2785914 RepID=UPI0018939B1B|nr:hypothetical protein [Methylobacter sp. BlB1]MBF6650220.1 hypothetical protein [Methylobacter sp. BlB1]
MVDKRLYERDNNIRHTLHSYITDDQGGFYWYHNFERLKAVPDGQNSEQLNHYENTLGGKPIEFLQSFLYSTLDEARLRKANIFAEYALFISDKSSFAYFRRAESRREISGEVDYEKHRDHAVHTLYNYLLGWYIFEKSKIIQENFRNIFQKIYYADKYEEFRKKGENEFLSKKEKEFYFDDINKEFKLGTNEITMGLANLFGDVWPQASLLHDIGYILEGSLSSITSEVEHERVTNGAKALHDYFNHWAWKRLKVDFRAAREIAKVVANCKVPNFKDSRSFPSLADHLRDVGVLENIRNKDEDAVNKFLSLTARNSEEYDLNLEAFKLWEIFYEKYIEPRIAEKILKEVKKQFESDVWEGGPTTKSRNLNHGVCGGLILLQAATFWYELVWGLESKQIITAKHKEDTEVSKKNFQEIKEKIGNKRIPPHIKHRCLDPDFFTFEDWIKDLWASSSVAIHDYVTKETWNVKKNAELKIQIEEDPLAYLQILVDLMQEWDRYTVLGESAFVGAELLQSYEALLEFDEKTSKFKFAFPWRENSTKQYGDEIGKNLERILIYWKKHIDLRQEQENGYMEEVDPNKAR